MCLNNKVLLPSNCLMFSLNLCLCVAANLPILIALMGRVEELHQLQVEFLTLNVATVDLAL